MGLLVVIAGGFMVWGLVYAGQSFRLPVHFQQERGEDEFPELRETWAYGSGETKVVMVPVSGMIVMDEQDGVFSSVTGSAELALRSIRRATHDTKVRALILDIDSGGGGITACDILHRALLDFKAAQPGRKIVAVFGDVAASGAYYISMAADHIVARPTTITGSIGVLLQTFNVRKLGDKIGVEDVTIKSGKNKDILNPFGELNDEQRAMLQGIVNNMHERFISLVAEGRRLPVETVRPLADGRILVADEAIKLGLVDEMGHWNEAMAATSKALSVSDIKVYRYDKVFSLQDLLKTSTSLHPRAWLNKMSAHPLWYLWQP
jgi:protease-4